MPVHCTIVAAYCPAAGQLMLTIGRAGVLSCRAIAAGELETLLRLAVERPDVRLAELTAALVESDRDRQQERERSRDQGDREMLRSIRRRPAAGTTGTETATSRVRTNRR